MKNTILVTAFLTCTIIQLNYLYVNRPIDNVLGDSTVSVYIGPTPTPTPIPTPIPSPTPYLSPTPGPSATPTPAPTTGPSATPGPSSIPTPTPYQWIALTPTPIITLAPGTLRPTPTPVVYSATSRFTLFGTTSPKAKVILSNSSISLETIANEKGEFSFSNQVSPISSREVCLETKDSFGRTSSPICLPPIPSKYNSNIGPVLMPPTISTDKKGYLIGESSRVTGQSIPKSQIELQLFDNDLSSISLVKSVFAKNNNSVTTETDESGNYSINISAKMEGKMKAFTRALTELSPSSRSNILNINIYPPYMLVMAYLDNLILAVKENLLNISFVIEAIIILIFALDYITNNKRAHGKAKK